MGVSSSSIPSHSWPTVSVPVGWSMRLFSAMATVPVRVFGLGLVHEDHRCGRVVMGARAWPQRPECEDEIEDHYRRQAVTVREMPDRFIGHFTVSCGAALSKSTNVPSICR